MEKITQEDRFNKIIVLFNKMDDNKLKEELLLMHESLKGLYLKQPASIKMHHAWNAGYIDHIYEVMELSIRFFNVITNDMKTKVNFSYDDVVLVSYVHDVNKLNRYRLTKQNWKLKKGIIFELIPTSGNCDESAEVVSICASFGIQFEQKHIEAISHHHGGFSNSLASPYRYPGSMTALSSLIHGADLLSQYLYGEK